VPSLSFEFLTNRLTYVYVFIATAVVFLLLGYTLGRRIDELRRLSATDSLTGLANRRAFHARLREEWLRARRYGSPLSLLLVDVDGLKRINDEGGHTAGDEVLRSAARSIAVTMRVTDFGAHANTVWNRYLAATGDFDGIGLVPFFLSCRAAIRAKTNATALSVQKDPARVRELQTSAREYLAMAERLLHPPSPCLVAIGGLSGSGKSALARALAPLIGAAPGAIVFRSDEIRKQILGVRVPTRLGSDGYTAEVTQRVYETLIARADTTVRNGFTAIVDGTLLRLADRQAMESVARNSRVPFIGLWLEAPVQTMLERVQAREHDASDADAAVLHSQLAQDTGDVSWHRLDSSASVEAVREPNPAVLSDHLACLRAIKAHQVTRKLCGVDPPQRRHQRLSHRCRQASMDSPLHLLKMTPAEAWARSVSPWISAQEFRRVVEGCAAAYRRVAVGAARRATSRNTLGLPGRCLCIAQGVSRLRRWVPDLELYVRAGSWCRVYLSVRHFGCKGRTTRAWQSKSKKPSAHCSGHMHSFFPCC
jgi:predicted kinase